ncbi:MAG: TIGR03621 family F420-dependent LLM class oxidoreductase [Gammaproteobacteria bacterium]|nr:TIGR03621 family F420-dependent LLM class oxidoreductase [Gammaproteobacteria bacterium]
MTKPFRFGVQSFNAESGQDWADKARKAEALGFSTLHLADHLLGPGPALEATNHPVQNIAAIPAMAYAAAVTKTINIGCRVFCIDYHNPVVLIKSAMTIDMLSGGRLELGLGAGWLQGEYEAIDLKFDEPKTRIDRLGDIVAGIKAFCSDGPADVLNDTIHWEGFEGVPKPVSRPPLMIGGGSPRILRLAGREADIVSLNFNNRSGLIGPDGVQSSSEELTRKKVDWVREGAGDRFDSLEIEIGAYFTFVMDDAKPVVENFAQMFGYSEEDMRKHPHALFGGVDTICEELERRRELHGISYVTVSQDAMVAFAPVVERLSGK